VADFGRFPVDAVERRAASFAARASRTSGAAPAHSGTSNTAHQPKKNLIAAPARARGNVSGTE
jgi:hypothetical protein